MNTDARELTEDEIYAREELTEEYDRKYSVSPREYMRLLKYRDRDMGSGNVFNGSTKIITSLLALMNILTAAAIVGGVVMYGKVTSLEDKVNLIIAGRIQIAMGQIHGP